MIAFRTAVAPWSASGCSSVPRSPFDQGADRGTVLSAEDEVAFPVPRERPILYFGGSVRDHHLVLDPFAALIDPALRLTQTAAGPQAGGELPARRGPGR